MNVLSGIPPLILDGFVRQSDGEPVLDGELTRSRARSLVECAVLSYKSRADVEKALEWDKNHGHLERFEWFEAIGRGFDSQAFACVVPGHVIVAFRGTKELRDFLTDALRVKRPLRDFNGSNSGNLGHVHLGFQRALNGLWSNNRSARQHAISTSGLPLDDFLRKMAEAYPTSQLWLTGHSLGAALATIAAARVQLTPDAPFKGRIGGLVTIGSPRVLDKQAADRLTRELCTNRICRIHRSLDPVPAVPTWGFDHVSGRKAFVNNRGNLVMGVGKLPRWAERTAAFLLAIEDSVGSALPGRHRGFARFVADHGSDDYLAAVRAYSGVDRVRLRDSVGPIVVPLMKLAALGAVGWSAAESTGVAKLAANAAVAGVQLARIGAETLLALLL